VRLAVGVGAWLLFSAPSLAFAEASPAPAIFALVVAVDRGPRHDADDEGVKYAEIFRTLAAEDANVVLHTDLDAETDRGHPWARTAARPPTKEAIAASVDDMIARMAAVAESGRPTELYFVFTGSGGANPSVPALALRDGELGAADIASMLRRMRATRSHVILDSPDSFFVVNSRPPGARTIAATAADARSLATRLPDVGVFLSTRSDASTFEKPELESGLFGHVVRSGLTGAADVNLDGEISYEELRAFVHRATDRIADPRWRPRLFVQGPRGNGRAPLARWNEGRGVSLRIDGPAARRTLRDERGVPVVDLHKEDGAVVLLHLPESWAEEHEAGRDVVGPAFASPFGPKAMAASAAQVRAEDARATYGVSAEDVERMRRLLAETAQDARGRRLGLALSSLGFAAGVGTAAGVALAVEPASRVGDYILIGTGALEAALGVWLLVGTSEEEALYARFERGTRPNAPYRELWVADVERSLDRRSSAARSSRATQRVLGIIVGGVLLALGPLLEVSAARHDKSGSAETWSGRVGLGLAVALEAGLVIYNCFPYPFEHLAERWSSDPKRAPEQELRPTVSVAPVRGGAQLGLGWAF
jgi:hypothetical protein